LNVKAKQWISQEDLFPLSWVCYDNGD